MLYKFIKQTVEMQKVANKFKIIPYLKNVKK